MFSTVLRRGGEWQAALTPAYQKRFVSPLNHQSQDFLEGRARSEKSEIVNGAGRVFAFVRSLTQVCSTRYKYDKGLPEHLLFRVLRLQGITIELMHCHDMKKNYLSLRSYIKKLKQERECGMKMK